MDAKRLRPITSGRALISDDTQSVTVARVDRLKNTVVEPKRASDIVASVSIEKIRIDFDIARNWSPLTIPP